MIVSRTPLRISFAGGGTDLPDFYRSEPGAVTGMTIDKYVYVAVGRRLDSRVRFSYARTEVVSSVAELEHPMAREALGLLGIAHGIEVVSVADVPAGTGLGSSSSFTVGLLAALHAFLGRPVTARELAAMACHIEMDRLGEPLGKQDQYPSALGGVLHLGFYPDERVEVEEVVPPPGPLTQLEESLLLLDTGIVRRSAELLADQAEATRQGKSRRALRKLRELAVASRDLLLRGGSLAECGALLHGAWECKRELSPRASTPAIDADYARALAAGAWGGNSSGRAAGAFSSSAARRNAARRSARR